MLPYLFDAPHLLKGNNILFIFVCIFIYYSFYVFIGIRNNLLTKNLIFTVDNITNEAKWQHIIDLYRIDSTIENVKMLPRLTDNHVIPEKISKMKVKCAAQIFSQRVSSLMAFLACKYMIIILFSIEIFDFSLVLRPLNLPNHLYISAKNIIDVDARGTANLCIYFD